MFFSYICLIVEYYDLFYLFYWCKFVFQFYISFLILFFLWNLLEKSVCLNFKRSFLGARSLFQQPSSLEVPNAINAFLVLDRFVKFFFVILVVKCFVNVICGGYGCETLKCYTIKPTEEKVPTCVTVVLVAQRWCLNGVWHYQSPVWWLRPIWSH